MGKNANINVFNRYTQKVEIEKVYGEKMVKLAYDSFIGKILAPVIGSKGLSNYYGKLQDSSKSRKKVPRFIRDFDIQIDDYNPGSLSETSIDNSYKSFNEFFIRSFKDGKRPFVSSTEQMGAFAEARYFGHKEITDELEVPVKGNMLKAMDLIGSNKYNDIFSGGPLMIARLCPVDYHRYHYPDDGKTLESFPVHGDYHSVNPIALKYRNDIFIKNERRVSILDTNNFGKLAYIEVGATCVGKIVQSFDEHKPFMRGDEKGYFLFGGSTVIICGEKGAWQPSQDIIDNTYKGMETYIHLGDVVAEKINR